MVRVAIAGGHGKLGRTIIEVLAEQNEHEAYILSGKVRRSILRQTHYTTYPFDVIPPKCPI